MAPKKRAKLYPKPLPPSSSSSHSAPEPPPDNDSNGLPLNPDPAWPDLGPMRPKPNRQAAFVRSGTRTGIFVRIPAKHAVRVAFLLQIALVAECEKRNIVCRECVLCRTFIERCLCHSHHPTLFRRSVEIRSTLQELMDQDPRLKVEQVWAP